MLGYHPISSYPVSDAAQAVISSDVTLSPSIVIANPTQITSTMTAGPGLFSTKVSLCKSKILTTFKDNIDAVIDTFGKTCRVYYPPKQISCVNCILDPIGNKSANRYLHGGPIPFRNGALCPVCNGVGYRAEETFSAIVTGKHN